MHKNDNLKSSYIIITTVNDYSAVRSEGGSLKGRFKTILKLKSSIIVQPHFPVYFLSFDEDEPHSIKYEKQSSVSSFYTYTRIPLYFFCIFWQNFSRWNGNYFTGNGACFRSGGSE